MSLRSSQISENDSMYYRHLLIEFAQKNDSEGVLDILEKGKTIHGLSDTKDEVRWREGRRLERSDSRFPIRNIQLVATLLALAHTVYLQKL